MTQAQSDSSGTFLKIPDQGQSGVFDYVFGTANGIFAVDTQNGAILGLKKAASKDFDPSVAGTYKAIYYQKTGASTGVGNVETGTASLANSTLVVTSGGQVTMIDELGNQIMQATLTPVADVAYLYGSAGESLGSLLWDLYFSRDDVKFAAGCLRHLHEWGNAVLFLYRQSTVDLGRHLQLFLRCWIEVDVGCRCEVG